MPPTRNDTEAGAKATCLQKATLPESAGVWPPPGVPSLMLFSTPVHASISAPNNVKGGNLGQPPSGASVPAVREAAGVPSAHIPRIPAPPTVSRIRNPNRCETDGQAGRPPPQSDQKAGAPGRRKRNAGAEQCNGWLPRPTATRVSRRERASSTGAGTVRPPKTGGEKQRGQEIRISHQEQRRRPVYIPTSTHIPQPSPQALDLGQRIASVVRQSASTPRIPSQTTPRKCQYMATSVTASWSVAV